MAAAGGNFAVLSDTVATRDAALPVADLLDQLRSPTLHAAAARRRATGALNHAVIHSLDITVALGRSAVAPAEAVTAVLDELTTGLGTLFGVDLTSVRLEAADADWAGGTVVVRADKGSLVTPERPSATRRTGPASQLRRARPTRRSVLSMLLSCPRLPYVSSV